MQPFVESSDMMTMKRLCVHTYLAFGQMTGTPTKTRCMTNSAFARNSRDEQAEGDE